jgi:hypothetical protein
MKLSILVAAIFMIIVSVINILWVILHIKITANTFEIPIWIGILEFVFTTALAIWLFIENKK